MLSTVVFLCLLAPAPDATGEPPLPSFIAQLPESTPSPSAPTPTPTPTPSPATSPTPAPEDDGQRIEVHGYLSQAFAVSDGNQILGIPSTGTFDYRTAALQLRASASPDDTFVIQASQDRLGQSPVTDVRPDVELDWVFYERRLGDAFSVRVGKVRIPFGIYSEVRYVGPLLPFFRAPNALYGEGSYTFDSLNGAVATVHVSPDPDWSVDVDVYGGEWRLLQNDYRTYVRAKNALGTQVWLNTPVKGLRLGVGGHRSEWHDSIVSPPGTVEDHLKFVASVDANLAPVRVAVEFEQDSFESNRHRSGYALVAWHATGRLSVNLQVTRASLRLPSLPVPFEGTLTREVAAGLSYAVRRSLVVKGEYHWESGREYDDPTLGLDRPERRTGYAVLSVATLF